MKPHAPEQLEKIPGVGKRIAQNLRNIGIRCVSDLKGKNPEELYQKLCDYKVPPGTTGAANPVDRCMLYVLRCAVYYASNTEHDRRLLKWWNWKDSR